MIVQAVPDRTEGGIAPVLAAIFVVTVARLVALIASPLDLGPDEAQYWRWGETLEWGYWSKPPLIAWAIHASTAMFGDLEWAVRFFAPLSHGIGAAVLVLLGREMFGLRIGILAGLGYLFMPGVTLSSAIMSTDGLLLPIWATGLLMLWRLREGTGGWFAAAGLGLAIGFGLLAKYAMMYFLIGLALVAVFDQPSRRALLSLKGGFALALAAIVFAPHLAWNAANSFTTVSHTADNANWGAHLFNPENALKFLSDQMGVFGPVSFLALLFGVFMMRGGPKGWLTEPRDRFLLAFILPALVIILVQAIISRAHANWAATAYPAASVLVAAWLCRLSPSRSMWWGIAAIVFAAAFTIPSVSIWLQLAIGTFLSGSILGLGFAFRHRPSGLLWTSIGLHAFIGLAFTFIAIAPVGVSENLGLANAFKRLRGWEETTAELAAKAREVGATVLAVDERENWHGLDYYGRDGFPVPIRAWRVGDEAKSYAEEFPILPGEDDRVLIASVRKDYRERMEADFATFEPAGELVIELGGGKVRRLTLFLASGYSPVPRSQFDRD